MRSPGAGTLSRGVHQVEDETDDSGVKADKAEKSSAVQRPPKPKAAARRSGKKRRPARAKGKRVAAASSPAGPKAAKKKSTPGRTAGVPNYPRHSLEKALRIPRAILDQNAGKPCTDRKAAEFAAIGWHGPTRSEIGSSIKYGLLKRQDGQLVVTDLAKQILRPQTAASAIDGMRKAIQLAPVISDVYSHFRGESLPEAQFLTNTLVDTFKIPVEKVPEFLEILLDSLRTAELLDETDGKRRIVDATHSSESATDNTPMLARLSKRADVKAGDSCFVMMPFASPIGAYYASIYEPAILKAGLKAVRADDEIFGPGKIIDQVFRGISEAKVLVAELTTKNPNVFYELGLAHALNKPVVLVSATANDNPFDIRHIRVIFYDTSDPFWGTKLIDKVAENILSALANPEEALFKTLLKDV
jgi:hypothetical protein